MSVANLNITQLTFNTINSNNRSTSNPLYFIPNPIDNIKQYAFSSFSGVNTVNVIDSRNNIINFSETTSSSTIRNVVIPVGNYTLSTLGTALKTGLDAAGTGTFTISTNSLTNIITIASTVNFKLLDCSNNIYYEIGFVASTAFAASQVASSIYDLSGLKNITLVSSSFGQRNSILVGSNYTVIGTIPVSTPFLGVISFIASPIFVDCQVNELNSASFMLLDERMRVLTVNNDWSLSLYIANA